ncbi:hypothetical protein [Sporomusa aerivorans]|uniref:hypothetical protein n=1 Tax=Sporomusa aerivorans TaxID=204936 RepID=UPI00352A5D36
MLWMKKVCIVVGLFLLLTGAAAPFQAQASSRDLTRVTVIFKVDNPDYFWHYPFLGKPLDQITVSSFGKTFTIPSSSDTDKIEIDVPTDYYLRLNIQLQSDDTTLQTIPYISKHRIRSGSTSFTIVLKAPEPQSVKISSDDFEAARP